MYAIDSMIDRGLQGSEWTTQDHRVVAVNACIGNPMVKSMDDLVNNIKIINAVATENIKTITGKQLIEAGCYI